MEEGSAAEAADRTSGPSAEEAQEVFDAFLQIMEKAATDRHIGQRLAFADIVVHIHFSDAPQDLVLTLFLDRAPIEAAAGAQGQAEVTLRARTADVLRFWTGDYHLAMGIARGEVEYDGPVRKLLRVIPIARRLVDEFTRMAAESNMIEAPEGRSDGRDR